MTKSKVLGLDIGFGSVKICYQLESGQLRYEKRVSAVAKIDKKDFIQDKNAFEFNGEFYYLFETALKVSSDKLLDIMSYEGLRESSVIMLRALLDQLGEFDKIVLGLSLSMVQYSEDYKKYISETLNLPVKSLQLVPQGIGAKIAYDACGLNPDVTEVDRNLLSKNYLGVDIGFNTVDVFQVIDGETTSDTIDGFEGLGVVKISDILIEKLKQEGITISNQDSKEVLATGKLIHRARHLNKSDMVNEIIINYIHELIKTLEEKYGSQLNKTTNIMFVGGGASLIKMRMAQLQDEFNKYYPEGFILIPEMPDYFNVIGYLKLGMRTAS